MKSHGSWGNQSDIMFMALDPDAWDEFRMTEEEAALKEQSEKEKKEKEKSADDSKGKKKGKKDAKKDSKRNRRQTKRRMLPKQESSILTTAATEPPA